MGQGTDPCSTHWTGVCPMGRPVPCFALLHKMEVAMFDPLLQIYDAAVDPIEELMWITGGWILYGPVLLLVVALVVLSIILIRRSTRKNKAQAFAEVPTQAYPPPVAGAEQAYPPQAGAPQGYPPPPPPADQPNLPQS